MEERGDSYHMYQVKLSLLQEHKIIRHIRNIKLFSLREINSMSLYWLTLSPSFSLYEIPV